MKITNKELKKLSKLTDKEKAIVYCKLNVYKTPKPFKYLKGVLSKREEPYSEGNIRSLLMKQIKNDIGLKLCSQIWWELNDIGNEEEYQIWWEKQKYICNNKDKI